MDDVKRRTKIQGSSVKKSKPKIVKKSKPKKIEEPITRGRPGFAEINNIVADTIERMYQEFGSTLDRVNCEDKAMMVTKLLRHGVSEQGLVQRPKLTERSMVAPLCRRCKEA
jgi:hypothetical protein